MTDIGRLKELSLFDAIQHGDDEHRAWLKAAIAAHFAGEPVPPPSGQGRKDAEIATLRARLAAAERVVYAARTYCLNRVIRNEWDFLIFESIAVYDQGKVTICDSAPTEGE